MAGAKPSVSCYEVKGRTVQDLVAGLRTNGRHGARATWFLSYQVSWNAGPSGCTVTGVSTILDPGLHMPRWIPPPGTAPDLIARWQRFMDAPQVHEDGHLAHGRGAERDTRSALAGMRAATCAALDAAAQARFKQIVDTDNGRDIDDDRETEQGLRQGAAFP